MIAAGRDRVGVSVSNSRFSPLQSGRDHPGMADRKEDHWCHCQRNSVSFNQSECSSTASLRATAILARLLPLDSAIL